MTVHYITRGKRKGVFLSSRDWNTVRKELETLHARLASIEKRRMEILLNFKKSKKEKHSFSSSLSDLKSAIR